VLLLDEIEQHDDVTPVTPIRADGSRERPEPNDVSEHQAESAPRHRKEWRKTTIGFTRALQWITESQVNREDADPEHDEEAGEALLLPNSSPAIDIGTRGEARSPADPPGPYGAERHPTPGCLD